MLGIADKDDTSQISVPKSNLSALQTPNTKLRNKKFSTAVLPLPNSFIITGKQISEFTPSNVATPNTRTEKERKSSIDSGGRFNVMPIANTAQVTETISPSPNNIPSAFKDLNLKD